MSSSSHLIIVSFLLVLFVLPAVQIPATAQSSQAPRIRVGDFTSLNWSGYAVTGAQGSVTDVKGSWIVPTIQGPCSSANQYSSFWVGIDGFSSSTVEQTGTDSDCQNGSPVYYAWYEFYPHPSFTIGGLTVHPGDVISAEVKSSQGRFTASIKDVSTGKSFSISQKVSHAQMSSAEWIAEAPSSGGILPLANFGTVLYGNDNTGVASTSSATVGGVTGALGSFGASVQSITMVTGSGAAKAQPSAISSDGTSFSITWVSSGP